MFKTGMARALQLRNKLTCFYRNKNELNQPTSGYDAIFVGTIKFYFEGTMQVEFYVPTYMRKTTLMKNRLCQDHIVADFASLFHF